MLIPTSRYSTCVYWPPTDPYIGTLAPVRIEASSFELAASSRDRVRAGVEDFSTLDFLNHELKLVKLQRLRILRELPGSGRIRSPSSIASARSGRLNTVLFSIFVPSLVAIDLQWLDLNWFDRYRFLGPFPQICEHISGLRRILCDPGDQGALLLRHGLGRRKVLQFRQSPGREAVFLPGPVSKSWPGCPRCGRRKLPLPRRRRRRVQSRHVCAAWLGRARGVRHGFHDVRRTMPATHSAAKAGIANPKRRSHGLRRAAPAA